MPMSQSKSRLSRLTVFALISAPAALLAACGDDVVHYHQHYYGEGGADGVASGGEPGDPGDPGGAGGDASEPLYPDAPVANTSVADHELDIFETWGNRYWFAVSDEQLALMNGNDTGGGPIFGEDGLYHPGGGGRANWVDHLLITTAGKNPQTADYGKVQARVVGQYSRFPWTPTTIPNLNIDADQFIEMQRIAGYEHLRFSNGQRGSIFRDKVAYDLYRALDYPAPLATYAWVQSNVWGPDISIPYTLVERYKRVFCERYAEQFGGGCPNMWEFVGDFNNGGWGPGPGPEPIPIDIKPGEVAGPSLFDDPENCQIDECDPTRVKELESRIAEAPQGEGFAESLKDYVDWPAFQRFQCLSWVLSTSDDTIHAGNNVVLVERQDGMFQYLPYSIDISMGFGGGWTVGLTGQSVLAQGCQNDPACWGETLDMCDDVIKDLTAFDPRAYLQEIYDKLDELGMLRPGDDANFKSVDYYFEERLANLPQELQDYRDGKVCEYPYVDCNGECVLDGECVDPCLPGGPVEPRPFEAGAGGAPTGGVGGEAGAGAIECPPVIQYRAE
jgi:hypothetical protein